VVSTTGCATASLSLIEKILDGRIDDTGEKPGRFTSLSISVEAPASGHGMNVYLDAFHVANNVTSCNSVNFDGSIWHIRDTGDGMTPVYSRSRRLCR
jgi:hypothetical protein